MWNLAGQQPPQAELAGELVPAALSLDVRRKCDPVGEELAQDSPGGPDLALKQPRGVAKPLPDPPLYPFEIQRAYAGTKRLKLAPALRALTLPLLERGQKRRQLAARAACTRSGCIEGRRARPRRTPSSVGRSVPSSRPSPRHRRHRAVEALEPAAQMIAGDRTVALVSLAPIRPARRRGRPLGCWRAPL